MHSIMPAGNPLSDNVLPGADMATITITRSRNLPGSSPFLSIQRTNSQKWENIWFWELLLWFVSRYFYGRSFTTCGVQGSPEDTELHVQRITALIVC